MVNVTPEEVMAARRPAPPGLSEIDRSIVGGPCRITVPLEDAVSMRRVGDTLSGLAEQLQALSRRTDLTERQVLMLCRQALRDADREIRRKVYGEPTGKYAMASGIRNKTA